MNKWKAERIFNDTDYTLVTGDYEFTVTRDSRISSNRLWFWSCSPTADAEAAGRTPPFDYVGRIRHKTAGAAKADALLFWETHF